MAIQTTSVTLDGLKYNLDDRDRVAAQLVNENSNTFSGTNNLQGNAVGAGFTPTASTALSAATTLAVNTLYHVTDNDTAVYNMPATATKGDRIEVVYSVVLGDGETHKYDCAEASFAASSNVFKKAGVEIYAFTTKPNGSSNDVLTLTGADDGGPGIGTTLTFIFNGTLWHVEGYVEASGDSSVAVTTAFGDT